MVRHPYTIRLARPDEEEAAFAVERKVWAPFNWMADGGVGLDYTPELHLVAVDDQGNIVANIDAFPFAWDGKPESLPAEGWRDAIIAAEAGFAVKPDYVCAHGASILPSARGGGLARDLLVALRQQALSLGYKGMVAPIRPTWRARMPHLSIEEYSKVRLADGRSFDPWLRTHEAIGGRIIGTTERSMYWFGERIQWEEWTGMKLPDNGSVLIDGSTGWLELVDGYAELIEDSIWIDHTPNA